MKYTLGPWTLQDDPFSDRVFVMSGHTRIVTFGPRKNWDEIDAGNATLITAALDLLEACELHVWAVNRYKKDEPCPRHQRYGCPYPGESRGICSRCVTETCSAAIAKAEGECKDE